MDKPIDRGKRMRVAMISMPTMHAAIPSFQLGLLQPTLQRHGIDIQSFSLFMYFGAHIGWKLNDALSDVRACMAGEWIWSKAAFGEFADQHEYLRYYDADLRCIAQEGNCQLEDLVRLRDHKTVTFLDFCMERIDWSRFGLIGFTVVFQQMTASLALARRLKDAYPATPIILGGATFEDDIAEGIMEACPYIDYIHCGDGDISFPKIVRRLFSGESIAGQPGLMWRSNGRLRFSGRATHLANLDSTPTPDFGEYFYARDESGYSQSPEAKPVMLPIETARGCWWGMKNHCTFCGLNRSGMEFRAKSVNNVLQMITTLTRRHDVLVFNAIDNIISPEYTDKLFGHLAEQHADVRLHYEVRPTLTHQQLRRMHRGGLYSVQPGIESFSTHMLKLMKKHCTGVRNIEFLKWCTYYEIDCLYNILYGFGGERPEDYELQSALIRRFPHLQPPWTVAQARADRGSPMFTQPQAHALARLVPSYCYRFIYPRDRFDLGKVSYYFDHEMTDTGCQQSREQLVREVTAWQSLWKQPRRPRLRYRKSSRTLWVEDARMGARQETMYRDREAELFEYCNEARAMNDIREQFGDGPEWIEEALSRFVNDDYMIFLDNRYLNLALPSNPHV